MSDPALLAPVPARIPASSARVPPVSVPHAPYPPATVVLSPGCSDRSLNSRKSPAAEKGDDGREEPRTIKVIPKAAGFNAAESGAPKLMASMLGSALLNHFFSGEVVANVDGDQMDIDDKTEEEVIEFIDNSPAKKGRTIQKTRHLKGFRDEDEIKTGKVKAMLEKRNDLRKTRTAKMRGVAKVTKAVTIKDPPENSSNTEDSPESSPDK